MQSKFERTTQMSMMVATIEQKQRGARMVGSNCGNGLKHMIEMVKIMRTAAGTTPLWVHANAGLPITVHGASVFPESLEEMASSAKTAVALRRPVLWPSEKRQGD